MWLIVWFLTLEEYVIDSNMYHFLLTLVFVNRAVSFECPVEGTPEPSIQWIVNDQPITASDLFLQFSSAATQLHILRY